MADQGGPRPDRPEPLVNAGRARWLRVWSIELGLRGLAGLAIAVQLIALYLPGDPARTLELPWLPGADKVVHLLLFAAPVYLLGRLTRRVGLVAGLFAVHAGVSELVQWWLIPYRDGDVLDALADLTGIALAVLLLRTRPPRS